MWQFQRSVFTNYLHGVQMYDSGAGFYIWPFMLDLEVSQVIKSQTPAIP